MERTSAWNPSISSATSTNKHSVTTTGQPLKPFERWRPLQHGCEQRTRTAAHLPATDREGLEATFFALFASAFRSSSTLSRRFNSSLETDRILSMALSNCSNSSDGLGVIVGFLLALLL